MAEKKSDQKDPKRKVQHAPKSEPIKHHPPKPQPTPAFNEEDVPFEGDDYSYYRDDSSDY